MIMSQCALVVALCCALLCPLLVVAQPTLSLNDRRIVSNGLATSLDGKWTASSPSQNLTMSATIPGDLITDLINAKVIEEVLYENNFKNGTIWNDHVWNYERNFVLFQHQIDALNAGTEDVWLVFDGIKMGANIVVNGHVLGQALSQFDRYLFSLRDYQAKYKDLTAADSNTLQVQFDPKISTAGQFMQCTGGCDWAPYSDTVDVDGFVSFSRGIWKNVYLVEIPNLAIVDVVPVSTFKGGFPNKPLFDGHHAGFRLNVSVSIYAVSATSVRVAVRGSWQNRSIEFVKAADLKAGLSTVSVLGDVAASEIQLWWPVGTGEPHLYDLSVSLSAAAHPVPIVDTRRIGFKFFAIVTGNDTDPAYVEKNKAVSGTDTMGMLFRINGKPIMVRGANMIPMDELEGRYSAEAHQRTVISARDGGMNILRIWGGGVYLPQVFYDTADEIGVLIFHDMMNRDYFSGKAWEASSYHHQIRRLAHHASIAIWDGCNECQASKGDVVNVVVNIIAAEDQSRPVWPSCPAPGWKSGVNRLSSLPDGSALIEAPGNDIETHGPYQHGDGWPAVNGDNHLNLFDPMTPQTYSKTTTGLQYASQFTSEFGSVGYSSFESMAPTLDPSHWSLHGGAAADNCSGNFIKVCKGENRMSQRNYPCDSIIVSFWGGQASDLDAVGDMAFKKQLYQCNIGQALVLKGYIEEHRSRNTFGLQIWQLNEIWPTGGWGTLEYGTPLAAGGQVLGGRWKQSHHWLRDYLYRDIMLGCGKGESGALLCYVKNDAYVARTVVAMVFAYDLATSEASVVLAATSLVLPAGPGSIQWLSGLMVDGSKYILQGFVDDSASTESLTSNFFLLSPPSKLNYAPVKISAHVNPRVNDENTVDITIDKTGAGIGVWVTMTTLAAGRFSTNAFMMVDNHLTVQFISWGGLDLDLLTSSLRIEWANQYMAKAHADDATPVLALDA